MWSPKRRVALIDGDIVCYSCAWVTDKQPNAKAAFKAAKEMLLNMREALELDDARIFLSSPNNFRKGVSPTYKANRSAPPKHLRGVQDYLRRYWDAESVDGLEADDLLGIFGSDRSDAVIATIDKDLNQVPGWHYNWRKYILYNVTPDEAEYSFWTQMLTGDVTDNIKGVKGIGPKTAKKLLEPARLAKGGYEEVVRRVYEEHGALHDYDINYKLLYILREMPENG